MYAKDWNIKILVPKYWGGDLDNVPLPSLKELGILRDTFGTCDEAHVSRSSPFAKCTLRCPSSSPAVGDLLYIFRVKGRASQFLLFIIKILRSRNVIRILFKAFSLSVPSTAVYSLPLGCSFYTSLFFINYHKREMTKTTGPSGFPVVMEDLSRASE